MHLFFPAKYTILITKQIISLNTMECADIKNLSKSWVMPMPDMYSFKSIHQIAVDWASNNWYFLDDTLEIILLCALKSDLSFATVLVHLTFNPWHF